MEVEVLSKEGTAGKIDLPDGVFKVRPRKKVLYEAVRSYLANQRQGNASTKGRSEVNAGGRKPWRQKGTGRARAGTVSSPIWKGGGIAHGPKPRDYYYAIPKKERRLAIRCALSIKAKDGRVKVVEGITIDEPRTRLAADLMKSLGLEGGKYLFVLPERDENILKGMRNIPGVKTTVAKDLNVYDVLNCDTVILDRQAVDKVVEVLKR
jgi:large subunit ribosomal protein L4